MTKGVLSYDSWYLTQAGFDSYYYASRVVDGKTQTIKILAHCLACAKTKILAKHGGKVDIRGWQKQGICGTFLKSMTNTVAEEGKLNDDTTE